MKDFTGREIQMGDIIVYGKALGRCAAVNIGVVCKLVEPKMVPAPYNRNKFVEKGGAVTVFGNHDTWKRFEDRKLEENTNQYSPWGEIKKSTIKFPERCVVVNEKVLEDSGEMGSRLKYIAQGIKQGVDPDQIDPNHPASANKIWFKEEE